VDLNLTESQLILGKAAREFLAAECPPSLVKQMENDPRGYPVELWQRIARMGWLGVVVPEEYGGQDGGFMDLLVLLQELGRAALPGPFFSTAILGGFSILEGASMEQKRSLLPRLCSGDLLLSPFGFEIVHNFGDHNLPRQAETVELSQGIDPQ